MENENENIYKQKYLKYKQKYINLVEQLGGILYKPGKYVFLFNSSILNSNTPLLNSIEQYNTLNKPDINKITNEIGNNNGWYYYKGLIGTTTQLKLIESSVKVVASSAKSGALSAASAASSASKKIGEKTQEMYCNSCRKSCAMQGGTNITTINLDVTTKEITESYIEGLVSLLGAKDIIVDRAIYCVVGSTGNKIIKYYKF